MNLIKSLSPPPGYARFEWPGTSGGKAGFDDVNPAAVGPALSRSLVNVGVSRTDLAATTYGTGSAEQQSRPCRWQHLLEPRTT